MELVDRIKVVMKVNNLSAAQMADEMGIQRSNVSHILSGRNKPGFDFLSKLLIRYPKVNAHWLITGKSQRVEESVPEEKVEGKEIELPDEKVETDRENEKEDIERVMIFYRNGTFKTFTPGSDPSGRN